MPTWKHHMDRSTLNYARRPRRTIKPLWRCLLVAGALLLVALITGAVVWRSVDWWLYIGSGPAATPKFEAPVGLKLLVSFIVGLTTACLAGIIALVIQNMVEEE